MATHDDFEIPKTTVFGGKRGAAPLLGEPAVVDAFMGIVVLILAILGLADVAPRSMAALGCMGFGIAALLEGLGVVRRYHRLVSRLGRSEDSWIRWAMIAQIAGGGIGFALGVLALVGIEPLALAAIASIVFGASLVLGTGAEVQVDTVGYTLEPSPTRRVIHEAVTAASGARLFVAVASITLGVLALAGVETLTLLLTASLLLGVALLLGSVAVGDRLRVRDPGAMRWRTE